MAHPSRDRLTTVPLHSGPSAEKKQCNSTGKRRNFLSSLRVSRGDERRVGGFDDFSECMNTNVLVLDGTSKLFLVIGVGAEVLCTAQLTLGRFLQRRAYGYREKDSHPRSWRNSHTCDERRCKWCDKPSAKVATHMYLICL